jgi:ATP-dependent RNA helicase RhlE
MALKDAIEDLMKYKIPLTALPDGVEISSRLTPEEKIKPHDLPEKVHNDKRAVAGGAFHEKSAHNVKEIPKEKAYRRKLKEKYKKPQRRGDKIQNTKKKRK